MAVVKTLVHTFRMGDNDDPEIYAAQPIWEWQQTEHGKYVMEHSNPRPMWLHNYDYTYYGNVYIIKAYFTPEQLTYYKLRFE